MKKSELRQIIREELLNESPQPNPDDIAEEFPYALEELQDVLKRVKDPRA